MRQTVSKAIEFRGVGLHDGQPVHMAIHPAKAGAGILFIRTDREPAVAEVPARYDLVSDTRLCSKLTNAHGVSVGTVEHVMAALHGSGVTDAVLRLDGPEVPIMDGSAAAFVEKIAEVGLRPLGVPASVIRILKPVSVEKDGKHAVLLPSDRIELSVEISFEDPAIGHQIHEMALAGGAFADELSDCRTFGRLAEVEQLRKMGLAKGGGLENAIVVDRGRVLNPGGLRCADEFVRHKMLDAVGDLALAGMFILGRYEGFKTGHEMTNLLLRELFASPGAWCIEPAGDDILPDISRASGMAALPEECVAI